MSSRFAAFKHSSYQRYFGARFCTALAAQILSMSVAWQIYEETRNAALLGWIGLVQFLPALCLVLITGLVADRMGRRLVMGCAILVETVCAASILFLAVTKQFDPVIVLGLFTLFGCARAFFAPASSSLAVNLVPKKDFANAAGFSALSWQSASIVGPAIGGLLQAISNEVAYSTSAGLFLLAAILIFSIPKPKQLANSEPTKLSTLLGGFDYVWKQKVVLGAISLDLFAVLLGGAVALLPVYAHDILHMDEKGFGILRAAPGVGAVLMMGVITLFPIKKHAGMILFVSVGLFGLTTAAFGASTIVWLSVLMLVLIGAFDMVSVFIREVLLQLWTPDRVRGRVNAVNSIFLGASNELGEARAGFMAAFFGPVVTVVGGGLVAMGIAAGWAFLFPQIRKTSQLTLPDRSSSSQGVVTDQPIK